MTKLLTAAALFLAMSAVACDAVSPSDNAGNEPAMSNQLRAPGLPGKGSVPDDSIKPGTVSGIPDDTIKPVAPVTPGGARGGIPDDTIKPVARGGVPDDSVKPIAPSLPSAQPLPKKAP